MTNCLFITIMTNQLVNCFSHTTDQHYHPRSSMFVARRSAEDSRPLSRVNLNTFNPQVAASESNQDVQIVMGKFKAPSPDRIYKARIPKQSNLATQTMSASFRVTDVDSTQPEKVVHGIVGQQQRQQASINNNNNKHVVSAKIQVSDEGLNYPPSKLSADIYGNVAEIVTAPPEAVDNDFLIPSNNQMFGARRGN